MKAVIHWKIPGYTKDHGEPIDIESARGWVEKMNKKYGPGTHWLKTIKMKNPKLTKKELKMLEECQTAMEWSDACDAIKDNRAGIYPEDWWSKVKESGMMDRIMARWVS